jgi:micrococcal nuclease
MPVYPAGDMSTNGYTSRPAWRRGRVAGATCLAFALVLAAVLAPRPASTARILTGTVTRVVDGDTITVLVAGRAERVRYIGMDTPETRHPVKGEEPGGREAAAANRALVLGKTVRLELDVRERDRYQRLLAYVYVGELMVNAEMVRRGCAHAVTLPPNVAHAERLVRLEREARQTRRGLWGHPDC